jgi:hypothetical protein
MLHAGSLRVQPDELGLLLRAMSGGLALDIDTADEWAASSGRSLRQSNVQLPADAADKSAIDLSVARDGSAPPGICTGSPDRVVGALPNLSAAMLGKMPLELAAPHRAMVTVSASVLASAGAGTGSPSSR